MVIERYVILAKGMLIMRNYNDSKYINKDTVSFYTNTNEEHLVQPVKGIIAEFPGLDGGSCIGGTLERGSYSNEWTKRFGEKGIIVAYMFPGPWSWGSKGVSRIADAVVAALADKYGLETGFPVAACGGSMGGVGTVMYVAESRYKLCGAAIACPCVDAEDRLMSHPDFPRTYLSAVAKYDMEFEDGLKSISPIHRIQDMQKIPYFICSDAEDEVFPEEQCDLYVEKLKNAGHDVVYYKQPGEKHGGFLPEIREKLHIFLENCILGKEG